MQALLPELPPNLIVFCSSELDEEAKRFMGVLVFLPGEHEIIRLKKAFDQHAAKFKLNWWTMPLYSRMPFEQME